MLFVSRISQPQDWHFLQQAEKLFAKRNCVKPAIHASMERDQSICKGKFIFLIYKALTKMFLIKYGKLP